MKKLFSLLAALALVLTLAACGDTKIEYVEVEVPVEVEKIVTEYVEVEVPVEVEVIKEVIVTETVTETIEVPADVENERFYKPGVYFTNTEVSTDGTYTYAVVVVDAYGKIAGIMFDDTKSTSEFLINEDGDLYVYVEGDGKSVPNTYRAIDANIKIADYPTAVDAINADDLVVGIHQAEIAELEAIEAYETSRVLGEAWITETNALVDAIIADQSTYGVLTAKSGAEVTAINVDTDLTNVDVLLGLVQDVLDGEAALTEEVVLATTPVKGLYTPGFEFGITERKIGSTVYYYTSFVVVDEFGRIAGVYNDATTADKTVEGANATKAILKEAYGMGAITGNTPWYLQAQGFSNAIVKNQGTDFVVLSDLEEGVTHQYTDQIAGTTIGVEGLVEATEDALAELTDISLNDGTYFVAGAGETKHAFMYVTIEGGAIESVLLDNTQGTDQASVMRDDEWFPVFTFTVEYTVGEEEKSQEILVYQDGEEYYPLFTVTVDGTEYEFDEEVEFQLDEENGIDEMATLEIVPGNYTKQMLNDRYGMNAENNWYAQADTLAAAFVKGGVYGINLTEDGHTDVTGVTFGSIDKYQQLLVEALILASEDNNELFDYSPVVGSALLADGTYFASSEVDAKGQQQFAWMNVVNGDINTIVFDSTIEKDGVITTIGSLGDAYGLAEEDTDKEWYEQAASYANQILTSQAAIITDIETGYDYEKAATFGTHTYAAAADPKVDISVDTFNELTTTLIQQALAGRVAEQAEAVFATIAAAGFDKEFVSNDGIVNGIAGLDFVVSSGINLIPTWETADDNVLDVESNDTSFEVQEVETNSTAVMTLTLEFGDFEESREFTYTVVTKATDMANELNHKDLKLAFGTITDKFDLPLFATTGTYAVKWIDEDGAVLTTPFNATDLTGDDKEETVVLTAWIDVDADDEVDTNEVSRDFTIVVKEEAAAIAEVAAAVKPGNILEEVTATKVTGLTTESGIGGITITWDETTGGNGQLAYAAGELTVTRSAVDTYEVTLTADVNGTDVNFEFFVVEADDAMVQARVEKVVGTQDDFALAAMYLDGKLAGTFGFAKSYTFDADAVTIAYSVDKDATATINATTGLLTWVDATDETVEVILTFTVAGTDVEFTRIAEVVLFNN
ncbi:hypothetical protein RJG79_06455 [Mycoplasmatota bacterium WC44]